MWAKLVDDGLLFFGRYVAVLFLLGVDFVLGGSVGGGVLILFGELGLGGSEGTVGLGAAELRHEGSPVFYSGVGGVPLVVEGLVEVDRGRGDRVGPIAGVSEDVAVEVDDAASAGV